jgi:hypothetical protein
LRATARQQGNYCGRYDGFAGGGNVDGQAVSPLLSGDEPKVSGQQVEGNTELIRST